MTWTRLLALAILPAAAMVPSDLAAPGASAAPSRVHVDLSSPAGALFVPGGLGTAVPIWNSPSQYASWAEGFRRGGFRTFRFPNGTLSNEYHWNGKGSFDSAGIWTPSATEVGPGFAARSLWRGTTKDNYDARLPSHLTDGDSSTLWWGETFQDSIRPWAILDLKDTMVFDSVAVLWGRLRPDSLVVQTWQGPPYPWPQHADPKHWTTVLSRKVTASLSGFAVKGARSRFVALRPMACPKGVQVREVRLFLKGKAVTVNSPLPRVQTKVVAISAHPGSAGRAEPWIPEWTFDRFAEWLKSVPGSEALVCVNFGTGTPEEAAAWVRHANVVRKYGIRKWHVGNEMDGHWEEGGPVDPAQYAVRFAAFSKAMKVVDPTIEVYGPGSYSMEFERRRSARADGLSWMESFLARIGSLEKASGERLLDGVDFHAYPYYFEQGPSSEDSLIAALSKFAQALDTLVRQMGTHLADPGSRKVSLSEFNSTVKVTALTMEHVNGVGLTMMLQDLWSRFPDRAVSILWEPMAGEPMNPDGGAIESYGALRIFTKPRKGLVSDLSDAPTSAWWAQLVTRLWMGAPGSRVVPLPPTAGTLRVSAATDSVTWSVLAVNPSLLPETLSVAFPKAAKGPVELLSWTPAHYRWTERTIDGRALPNLGPTARRLASSEEFVVVPPRSVALLRRGSPKTGEARVLHAAWTPGRLQPPDTLEVFATVAADGDRWTGASWKVGAGKPVAVPSFDGAFDGSQEGVHARIPATLLPRGRGLELALELRRDKGAPLTIPVKFDHEDLPRPIRAIDHFGDASGGRTTHGQTWWTYGHGGNGTRMTVQRLEDALGGYLSASFQIVQPATQSYPNFALAGFNIGKSDFAQGWDDFRGIVFDLRTTHSSPSGKFPLQALTTTVKDYDDYQVQLPDTKGAWRRIWIRWEEFDQQGWGKDLGPFDPSVLRALQFRADGEGQGAIEIENLSFFGTSGTALVLPDPPRPSRGR